LANKKIFHGPPPQGPEKGPALPIARVIDRLGGWYVGDGRFTFSYLPACAAFCAAFKFSLAAAKSGFILSAR
jgi:hypothetical protein